jgi:AraC-like DNA-binding protein
MTEPVGPTRPRFRFFSVRSPLDRYVTHLFASEVPKNFVERVIGLRLPELEAQLVFTVEEGSAFPGAQSIGEGLSASLFLQPPHVQMLPIAGTIRQAVGASLEPAGLRLLMQRGAGDLSSAPLIPLQDLCGESARVLLDRLIAAPGPLARVAVLQAELHERACCAERTHVSAARAVRLLKAMQGEVSIEAVAQSCGVTTRTLRNVLLSETGLPPKQLARIVRIRHALDLMQRGTPLDRAESRRAFSDQAHMCREFRALLGTSPAALDRELHATPGCVPSFSSERELAGTGLLILAAANENSAADQPRSRPIVRHAVRQ